MAGLDAVASAMGIASLGIQLCQGLLSYYDSWKDYGKDVNETYASIADLGKTLQLLKGTLESEQLDPDRRDRVARCLQSGEDRLIKLKEKLEKLRTRGDPAGLRQKTWTELQRMYYPFRAGTLAKLKDLVNDVLDRLRLALTILHLDLSIISKSTLTQIETFARDTASRIPALEDAIAHVSLQTQDVILSQKGIQDSLSQLSTQNEIISTEKQHHEFQKITQWLSPPDPWTNHNAARQSHEPETGSWLLRSKEYQDWLRSPGHLWMHGTVGCGKTVLCSVAIEDVQKFCDRELNVAYAAFYFSFSDKAKQSISALLLSLIAQLGWIEPTHTTLRDLYQAPNARVPGAMDLEKILISCLSAHYKVLILLDALDECPEENGQRDDMLACLARLTANAPNLSLFTTSRPLSDITEHMGLMDVTVISINSLAVDADISKYVASEISRSGKLSRLDESSKQLIRETLTEKANGMFRWTYCQLAELKKLKSTRRRYLEQTLHGLPPNLDETYERMLAAIDGKYRSEAITALHWLANATRALTLDELSEATNVDLTAENCINTSDRGSPEDLLNILAGLVQVIHYTELPGVAAEYRAITFAHFSVKEYLTSERIVQTTAKEYWIENGRSNRLLADSCLSYLQFYAACDEKLLRRADFDRFPLLLYAATNWFVHSRLKPPGVPSREYAFLYSDKGMYFWHLIFNPERYWEGPFEKYCGTAPTKDDFQQNVSTNGGGLYWACYFGLPLVACELLDNGADVNAEGGSLGSAMAAALNDHLERTSRQISRSKKSNELWEVREDTLQRAVARRRETVARLLFHRGANVRSTGSSLQTILSTACRLGYQHLARELIASGANVNGRGKRYTPLEAASYAGDEHMAKMLIELGADIHAKNKFNGTAMHCAAMAGNTAMVEFLIDLGADINALSKRDGSALQVAAWTNNLTLSELLVRHGADIDACGGEWGNALQNALNVGSVQISEMLIVQGANVNAIHGKYPGALHQAAAQGYHSLVELLLMYGANINAEDAEDGRTALQAALSAGRTEIAKLLITRGADVNAGTKQHSSALHIAAKKGYKQLVELILEHGGNVNAVNSSRRSTALQLALRQKRATIAQSLIAHGAAAGKHELGRLAELQAKRIPLTGREWKRWRSDEARALFRGRKDWTIIYARER